MRFAALPIRSMPCSKSQSLQHCKHSGALFRQRVRCAAAGPAQQQPQQQQLDLHLIELPATHRRGVLQGMLGTAAITITSPAADAAQQTVQPHPASTNQQPGQPPTSCDGVDGACNELGSSTSTGVSGRGAAAARDPSINRGCATPASVRQQQQLSGLVPPRQVDLGVEVQRARAALDMCCTPLEKHRLLVTLKETNQAAFYALLQQDLDTLLPLVYTPTIGDACLSWGTLLPRPTGLYVSSADRGRVEQVLQHWPSDEVRLAVITDGERILGLGDLGAHGMGIPTGKCVVYGAAGANPNWLLPITVDVGTNNKQLLNDPLYVGQPQQRLRGQEYYELMMELVVALQRRFKRQVLVHWEDLAASNAFYMLQSVQRAGIATFNDDIQATAAVALAAVLGGVAVPGVLPLTQQRWLFFGAGQANLGTAQLLVKALQQQGMSAAAAKSRIWMVDSKGLILNTRQNLTPGKAEFAQSPNNLPGGTAAAAALGLLQTSSDVTSRLSSSSSSSIGSMDSSTSSSSHVVEQLAATVAAVQPTALVGAAAVPGAFGQRVIEALLQSVRAAGGPANKARPLLLALSNPTSKAEVSYQDAMTWSGGRVVYASGSPFPPLTALPLAPAGQSSSSSSSSSSGGLGGGGSSSSGSTSVGKPGGALRTPGQANNCLIFPGLGLGVVQSGAKAVTDELLLAAAQAVAGMVTAEELQQECVLPQIGRLGQVTRAVTAAVAKAAKSNGLTV